MAKVKFYKVNDSILSSLPIKEGQIIFVQDTGKLYIDKDDSTRKQIEGLDLAEGIGISIEGTTITNSGVREIAEGTENGTVSVNTNGSIQDVPVHGLGDLAYLSNIDTSKINTGTLGVARGGTGANLFTAGQVLMGNGTDAISTKAIDTTLGGTSGSEDLISSGAVYSGLNTKLNTTLKGANSGLAELDANGKVPSSQLPSYVDDVIEGYYYDNKFYVEDTYTTEITGETGKIYVDLSTEKTYRWSGSTFVVISETLALGETDSTAYRGDKGKIAYDHATDASRLTAAISTGLYKIGATAEGHISELTAITKADITGLDIPSSDTIPSGYCNVSSDSAEKTTNCTGYLLLSNSYLQVIIENDNTVQSALTLNVNNQGAKPIYINGTASSESNYTLPAGSYITFYDGTNYYFRTDGKLTAEITGVDSSLSSTSTRPVQNNIITQALDNKISASDIVVKQVLPSGAEVGTIQVGETTTTLYAPEPGNIATELVQPNSTYYLTGVTSTTASDGDQIYNTRLSNTFQGVKYETSASEDGGRLSVDGREVTLGLYYAIS